MTRHDTPLDVARVLARWVPKHARTILDPSVGTGALLAPVLARTTGELTRLVAIDRDQQAIQSVRTLLRGRESPSLWSVCADFLEWTPPAGSVSNEGFDCVLMNPPFDARSKVTVSLPGLDSGFKSTTRSVPVEVAFLLKAVACTRPEGRVVAILPGSVISAERTRWLRDHLLRLGSFLYVHELPSFTFPGVESRVYLVAFEKSATRRAVMLCNHSLKKPDRLMLATSDLGAEYRMDYEFHEATRWATALRSALPIADWVTLDQLAELKRGENPALEATRAIHSTALREGFWISQPSLRRRPVTEQGVRKSDLLIRRVGRRCAESLGCVTGGGAAAWTDCVIRIRPRRPGDAIRLLFAVRPLLGDRLGQRLVQRGSGATYLTVKDLGALYVPRDLSDMFPRLFATYCAAVAEHRYGTMLEVEQEVRTLFLALLDSETRKDRIPARRSD